MKVLSVNNLCKTYNGVSAVEKVSFDVAPGEIVGLLGPNGAGKTTTISMVLGVLEPTAGTITIEGVDLARSRPKALLHTNFTAVYAPLPGNMSVDENLTFFGLLYGVERLSARVKELIAQFDLQPFRNTKCGALSSGEQTRVSLAKAMLNRPNLLLLDEPTASLDPATARDIRDKIREAAAQVKGGILWTSHNMNEVEQMCDRVLFLSKGRILLEGNPRTLPAEHAKKSLEELFITIAREPLSLGEGL